MSRFLSHHEIKKHERLLNEDKLLNASKFKEELKDAINIENTRTNVDSAKKKAVMQGMNYDGFHQMVLGANLKGLKTNELRDFKPTAVIMNTVVTQNLYTKESQFLEGSFVVNESEKDINSKLKSLSLKEDRDKIIDETKYLKEVNREFKKNWKKHKTNLEKISLLVNCSNTDFEKMINCDTLDSDFFLDVAYNICVYIYEENKTITEEMKTQLLNYVLSLLCHSCFPKLKKFIGKKHKQLFEQLNENIKEIFLDGSSESLFNKIYDLVIN